MAATVPLLPPHDRVEHDAAATDRPPSHHHVPIFDPLTGLPTGATNPSLRPLVEQAAKVALATVGFGKGPAHGTAVHTQFRDNIRALKHPEMSAEQSYLGGRHVTYGTKGSVRVDAVEGSVTMPSAGLDLKTGKAMLSPSRVREMRNHLPNGQDVELHEIKP